MVVEYVERRTLVDMKAAPMRSGDCGRGGTALMRERGREGEIRPVLLQED